MRMSTISDYKDQRLSASQSKFWCHNFKKFTVFYLALYLLRRFKQDKLQKYAKNIRSFFRSKANCLKKSDSDRRMAEKKNL